MVGSPFDDPLGNGEADVGILGDAGLVVGDRHHRCTCPGHQGKYPLQDLLLAGHRVDQGLALVDGQACFQGLDDRRVDGQRNVGHGLDQLDGPGQQGGLVGQRDAGVDVQHQCACLDLGDGIRLHPAEVASLHLLGEKPAASGVDPLADHDERPSEADCHFTRGGTEDRVGHLGCSLWWGTVGGDGPWVGRFSLRRRLNARGVRVGPPGRTRRGGLSRRPRLRPCPAGMGC